MAYQKGAMLYAHTNVQSISGLLLYHSLRGGKSCTGMYSGLAMVTPLPLDKHKMAQHVCVAPLLYLKTLTLEINQSILAENKRHINMTSISTCPQWNSKAAAKICLSLLTSFSYWLYFLSSSLSFRDKKLHSDPKARKIEQL